MPQSS